MLVYLLQMIMTSKTNDQSSGLPPPITKLTVEQEFKLKQLEITLPKDEVRKEDIITVFLALQKQNYVLINSLTNLVAKWPKDHHTTKGVLPMFGILLENKD